MAYATQADLLNQLTEQELIELTDDASTGAVDAAKVNAAIAKGDADIDGYCRGRYALPLVASEKVKSLSVDLAIYYLEQRRRSIREVTQQAYDNAVDYLEKVAKGTVALDQPPSSVQTTELDVVTPDRTEQEDKLKFGSGPGENLEDY